MEAANVDEQDAKYYDKNREDRCKYQREYHQRNRERITAQQKEYYRTVLKERRKQRRFVDLPKRKKSSNSLPPLLPTGEDRYVLAGTPEDVRQTVVKVLPGVTIDWNN